MYVCVYNHTRQYISCLPMGKPFSMEIISKYIKPTMPLQRKFILQSCDDFLFKHKLNIQTRQENSVYDILCRERPKLNLQEVRKML